MKHRIRAVASSSPNAAATEVFFSSAISTLASGGTAARNACGRTPARMAPAKVSPIARAASAWPSGTELMPERIASHTNAEV